MCEKCEIQARTIGRRKVLALGAATLLAAPVVAATKDYATPPKPQNVLSPQQALERLMKGNERYVQGVAKRHDFIAEREALVGGQNPYAGILSCADSRIARNMRLIAQEATCSSYAWPATFSIRTIWPVSNILWKC